MSNKVPIVIVLVKTLSKYLISSVKLSGESQTSCARLVRVRMVVARGTSPRNLQTNTTTLATLR